jgi:hypothetical protein
VTATLTVTVTAYSSTPAAYVFALGSSGNISVNPGATTGNTATIAVNSTSGYSGQVNLICAVTTYLSNPVDTPTCSTPPAMNILSGSSGASTVLTVNTTAPSSATTASPLKSLFLPGGGVALGLLVFLVIPARRRSRIGLLGLLAAIVFASCLGCGGSGSHGESVGPPQQGSGDE